MLKTYANKSVSLRSFFYDHAEIETYKNKREKSCYQYKKTNGLRRKDDAKDCERRYLKIELQNNL